MTLGVLFDMDGVLVASGPAHAASWRAVARKHGLQITDEQFHGTFGRPSRDIIRILWGRELSDDDVRAIDDQKEAIYRDLITGMVPLTIGARECLQGLLNAGVKLAVATSGPRENLELVLREGRLEPCFAATVAGFDVPNGKPAPDCFLLAAERVGLPPRRCVVVEDAPVGIQAATAAGMKSIALIGTHPEPTLIAAGAAGTVQRLTEITPELVRGMLAA